MTTFLITVIVGLIILLGVAVSIIRGHEADWREQFELSEQRRKDAVKWETEAIQLKMVNRNQEEAFKRCRKERDAYLVGLGRISNMKTRGMANIGRRMSTEADTALERGLSV